MRPRYEPSRRDVTSKTIDGITDLVVWAPIKEGFIDAFVNVTYETRLRIVAEALHNVRAVSREFEMFEPYADTAKRILSLLDFRIGIVDRDLFGLHTDSGVLRPRKYMYLVATFDGPWEPYMREIWRPLGTFLDLILCNCEGYKNALDSSFEEYARWVRDNQLDSAIFYSTSHLTVEDNIYLSDVEHMQRNLPPSVHEEAIARHKITTPDDAAAGERAKHPVQTVSLGMEALNVLYKLTDYYPPVSRMGGAKHDGRFLLRAAHDLLKGLTENFDKLDIKLQKVLKNLYSDQLEWFKSPSDDNPKPTEDNELDKSHVQKGILTNYDEQEQVITHGVLMNSKITDPDKFREFLSNVKWSWEDNQPAVVFGFPLGEGVVVNIAFTYQGLKRLGLRETDLLDFPKEFRQGMQERAPSIGDKFDNHPRNWTLPERNWPRTSSASLPPVEPKEIDFLIQMRAHVKDEFGLVEEVFYEFGKVAASRRDRASAELSLLFRSLIPLKTNDIGSENSATSDSPLPVAGATGPAAGLIPYLSSSLPESLDGPKPTCLDVAINIFDSLSEAYGFKIINVEDMVRRNRTASTTVDHFGFADGISQPEIVSTVQTNQRKPWHVLLGDIVYGYSSTMQDNNSEEAQSRLSYGGSYMVVRKIQQNRKILDELEDKYEEPFIEKLVGRKRDGTPLVTSGKGKNDFDYKGKNSEDECPYSAHIRLAHPRGESLGRKHPMIVRRGMSYGADYDPDQDETEDPGRGILFVAYCANIGEQYEVIQRWLNAGNGTGVLSSQNDPLTGVFPKDGKQSFRYMKNGTPVTVQMTEPLTKLQWGEYFFLPSRPALETLKKKPKSEIADDEKTGKKVIKQIESLDESVQPDEWKRLLEDYLTKDPTEHNISPLVWKEISARGGAYRCEHGISFDVGDYSPDTTQPVILVTNKELMDEILENEAKPGNNGCPYTSDEQLRRCADPAAFGAIYVTIDEDVPDWPDDPRYGSYAQEAYDTNSALLGYSRRTAFEAGYKAGSEYLCELKDVYKQIGQDELKLELGGQYIQPTLAKLCAQWFGIPDGTDFEAGAWTWTTNPKKAVCPGEFLAPSRHVFYPRPTNSIDWIGKKHGKSIREAIKRYINKNWNSPTFVPGEISNIVHRKVYAQSQKDPKNVEYYKDLLGRNIVGIMVGALPPMEASMRSIFFEGLEDGKLWRWQSDYQLAQGGREDIESRWKAAEAILTTSMVEAMCIRPAPDLIYRTVKRGPVQIGNVKAESGDLVILCIPAATQKTVEDGAPDATLIFGGDRLKTGKVPLHACPAREMAMGGMMGIISALLDAGRIQALPASLIVRLSEWTGYGP